MGQDDRTTSRDADPGDAALDGADPLDGEDALDREFGLDPHTVPRRTGTQIRRTALLATVVTVVAAVLVAGTLFVTIRSVQNGIGGVLPQPASVLARFEHDAERVDGVTATRDLSERRTQFLTGYDVSALVTARADLSLPEQEALVDALGAAAHDRSGSGVQVLAEVVFGDVRVGVSADRGLGRARTVLAEQLAALDDVTTVRCTWATTDGQPVDDRAATQTVAVTTTAPDDRLTAVQTRVSDAVHAAFPKATLTVTRHAAGG